MSWDAWMNIMKGYEEVDADSSAIMLVDGTLCIAGPQFKLSKDEFTALKTAIMNSDGSSGKMIGGKKFMIIGGINDQSCNLKCNKENYNVTFGSQYALFLKGKQDVVIERLIGVANQIVKSLHGGA